MSSPSTRVLVFGNDRHGCLGLGRPDRIVFEPRNLSPPPVKDGDTPSHWTQIACGRCHTVALSSKGEVFTWGRGDLGCLGHGGVLKRLRMIREDDWLQPIYHPADESDRYVPTKVMSLSGETIVKVACGTDHTMALTEYGKLLGW